MRWALVFALLATLALLTTAQETPPRALRTPLELQEAQRRAAARPPAAPAPAADSASRAEPATPVADPLRIDPDQRAVQVFGADDRPAVGVGVRFTRNGKGTYARTDRHGLARFDPVGQPARAEVGGRDVELAEPLTVVRLDALVPVTAVLVDAGTGRLLDTPCRPVPTHVLTGQPAYVRVQADAPNGYVVFETGHSVQLARSAPNAVLRIPARPEARLTLRVRTADGKPAAGGITATAAMGADRPEFRDGPAPAEDPEDEVEYEIRNPGTEFPAWAAPAGANGQYPVHGVPFLQGERIGLTVVGDRRYAWVETRLPARNDGCTVDVRLPARENHPAPESNVAIGLGGGCGGRFRRARGTATAEFVVYRRDGTPAPGVLVSLLHRDRTARTDADGMGRFPNLPGGTYRVTVLEPGFTRAETTLALAAGNVTRVRLDEPPGWNARILVLDEWEHPVPFAKLHVVQAHDVVYADLAEGVHDLVRYTNEKGEAEFARLSDGVIEITATFGTRRAKGKVEPGTGLAILRLGADS